MADAFHFADGTSAADEQQLLRMLEQKDEGLTQPHVLRRDYANWVRHALGKDELAQKIAKCRTVQDVVDVLHVDQVPKRQPQKLPEEKTAPSKPTPHPTARTSTGSSPLDDAADKEEELREHKTAKHKPIHDLLKPSQAAKKTSAHALDQLSQTQTPSQKTTDSQETSGSMDQQDIPAPLPHQSLSERYNAREFLMGFITGVVLTVVIFGILGSLG